MEHVEIGQTPEFRDRKTGWSSSVSWASSSHGVQHGRLRHHAPVCWLPGVPWPTARTRWPMAS